MIVMGDVRLNAQRVAEGGEGGSKGGGHGDSC